MILDSFPDWMIDAQVIAYTEALNTTTGRSERTAVPGATIKGIKYTRSQATRYFSKVLESKISDVFVMDSANGITNSHELLINGVYWACDTPENVGEQNEVWIVGLEVKK